MSLSEKFKLHPYHTAGLIVFFISHGYSEYTWFVPFGSLMLLLAGILAVAFLLYLVLRKTLSSGLKAGLLTTWIFAFLLFYGVVQELFKEIPFFSWLSRYRYLVPAFLLSVLLLYILLRRSKKDFSRITLYLNTLFVILVVIDSVVIVSNLLNPRIKPGDTKITIAHAGNASALKKPDIYFIVLDEYSGTKALETYFNYNNSGFENELRSRGFFVAASPRSNYPATLLSMASILSMDTVKWLNGRKQVIAEDYTTAKDVITNSEVPKFLQSIGYRLYNFSIFDIAREKAFMSMGFISVDLQLITAKTIVGKMEKDLVWNLLVSGDDGETNMLTRHFVENFRKGIQEMLSATRNVASEHSEAPKFIYTHLMMPHPPFLYDSTGTAIQENAIGQGSNRELRAKNYLQYLVHTNKVIVKLVNDLQDKTKGQAVIIVLSDHGYRALPRKKDPISWSSNLNAVYIPTRDYRYFYDSISNVNQFRVLFNTLFDTRLPVLPDTSCIFALSTGK